MKNPTTILITVCDGGGYNVYIKEHYGDYHSSYAQYACESFESLVNQLVRSLGLKSKYQVIIKKKED